MEANLIKLVNRAECVVLHKTCSSLIEVSSEAPQGSVLGPWLFVMFISYRPTDNEIVRS